MEEKIASIFERVTTHVAIGEHICAMYQITVIRYNQYAADKKKSCIVIALEYDTTREGKKVYKRKLSQK